MTTLSLLNPFAPLAPAEDVFPIRKPPSAAKPQGAIEHLPSMKDVREYLEWKARDLRQLPGSTTRSEEIHHLEFAAGQCEKDHCDPWHFEYALFKDLVATLEKKDMERVNLLRGLLRAGSWWTHERLHRTEDVVPILRKIRQLEETHWNWRSKHQDEHGKDAFDHGHVRQLADIDRLQKDLEEGRTGNHLLHAAETVDRLNARAWLEYEKARILHTSGHVLESWKKELEELRPVRNLVYFRLLYPALAAYGLKDEA